MASVLGVIQSPVFLGLLLLLGLFSLLRVLSARDPGIKRTYIGERRGAHLMPVTPFHDSEGVLVNENRRSQVDRRHCRILAMQHAAEDKLID